MDLRMHIARDLNTLIPGSHLVVTSPTTTTINPLQRRRYLSNNDDDNSTTTTINLRPADPFNNDDDDSPWWKRWNQKRKNLHQRMVDRRDGRKTENDPEGTVASYHAILQTVWVTGTHITHRMAMRTETYPIRRVSSVIETPWNVTLKMRGNDDIVLAKRGHAEEIRGIRAALRLE